MEFTPGSYPPFPRDIPHVELETFKLKDIEKGDEDVERKLFETCRTRGFFYLDMNGSSADSLREDSESLGQLAEAIFKLPLEEKEKYPMKESLFGYKRRGASKTDGEGTPDTAEFFNISKDAMLDNATETPRTWPQLVLDHKALLARYMRVAHGTGLKILTVLGTRLGLSADEIARRHRIGEESGDHVRMTRGPARQSADMPEIQTPGHTDFGTITILFNWLGGLQVWSDPARGGSFENVVDPATRSSGGGEARWLWVVPPPAGHAIVNLGDAAVKYSGGVLCSGRHRVVPAPGEQGKFPRYSLVYFVRPEDKSYLQRLQAPGIPALDKKDEEITAKEWIIQQATGLGIKVERS